MSSIYPVWIIFIPIATDANTTDHNIYPDVCVGKVAQLPPRGDVVWAYRKKEREQAGRLREWRDYAHTVDWSLKRSCSVQLGSTSLRRT